MSSSEIATQPGLYWTLALFIAVVVVSASIALARYIARARRERERLLHETEHQAEDLRESRARIEAQQRQLEQASAQLAEQARQLTRQTEALAEAQRASLDKASELTRAHESKSQLLASLSHELRPPLNSALILSQLLADNGQQNLTPEQVKFARTINSAGHDLLDLLNDILDLANIEARKSEIHHESIEVGALVATLAQTVRPLAEEKRLDLAIRLAPDVPATLASDSQRLAHVLRNLLSLAVKSTDRGNVSLDVNACGREIEFAVRTEGAMNRRAGGTGLALSIARELAVLLGGRIESQGTPGEDTTFRFILPTDARMMTTPIPS
jgi:signal transduction histidine kinase